MVTTAMMVARAEVRPTQLQTNTRYLLHSLSLAECQNNNMNCAYWAQRNYCTTGPYQSYMRTNCRESCGVCTSTGTGDGNGNFYMISVQYNAQTLACYHRMSRL